jgi:KAP family P-loop domain
LQVITLILSDSRFFVFLGMDTEMIHRAIRAHYSKDQADAELPPNFAEKYLRKIIQVSFYLPDTSKRSRLAYLKSLFSVTPEETTEPVLPEGSPRPFSADEQPSPPPKDGNLPFSLSNVLYPQSLEVQDTAAELTTFQDHLEFLEDNPCEIKRLINLHRLVKIILAEKQLLLRREVEQSKLVRWLIFCAKWPDLIDDCFAAVNQLAAEELTLEEPTTYEVTAVETATEEVTTEEPAAEAAAAEQVPRYSNILASLQSNSKHSYIGSFNKGRIKKRHGNRRKLLTYRCSH